MGLIHGVVFIYACFQAASSLRVGNYPQSRANVTVLPLETQLNIYARIISRYDIIAVPGITDPYEMEQVAEMLKDNYKFYLSTRILKPTLPSIDYHGIFYKSDVVSVGDFVRDQPTGALCLQVKMKSTGQEFAMALVHLSGTDVINELEGLPSAFDRLQKFFHLESIMFIGDFNTFPFFLTEAQFNNVTVTRDPLYEWFIEWTDQNLIPVLPFLRGAAARFLMKGDINNWVERTTVRVLDNLDFFNLTVPEAGGMGVFLPTEMELKEPILRT